jgi:hypothetical protein
MFKSLTLDLDGTSSDATSCEGIASSGIHRIVGKE